MAAAPPTLLKRISVRLNSKRDKLKLHKSLGISCGLHFIFRYIVFARNSSYGFDAQSWLTVALLFTWHMSLSVSSLIFHVPAKRPASYVMMIWEEYRQHAIVFTLRSYVLALLSLFFSSETHPDDIGLYAIKFASVLGCHYLADVVTKIHGSRGMTSVRGTLKGHSLKEIGKAEYYSKIFFSWAQIVGASGLMARHLTPAAGIDGAFAGMMLIQFSAFFFTLQKSGIISPFGWNVLYGVVIVAMLHVFFVHIELFFLVAGTVVAYFRTVHGVNKFVLWFSFFMVGVTYSFGIPQFALDVVDLAEFGIPQIQFQVKNRMGWNILT
eukprot:CAMPEP_0202704654 /NCGR_PEP_ID=MMETSP1385-20130828/17308_1 /ASSEMBLY_ACC=CAM_ASM_000861 /TAXON_ID=933848 /ORGANISM="Elphidium margaritaceum" /LENGTH=323 /DNA_ID=CAMNT_0049362735 /DNA_START=48 /DNA_END=1019 /DNA_ORIENTATION=-